MTTMKSFLSASLTQTEKLPALQSLHYALNEVSASSAGGAPFLIAYGGTFLITAVLTLFLPGETTALIAMFQGGLALPIALWLERKMGSQRMSKDNPLKSLSAQLAMAQALALPILIVAYNINAGLIPIMLASFGGMHFIPYAWLQRTRIYLILGAVLGIGAFGLQVLFGSMAYTIILFFVTAVYWLTAPLVYRHAAQLTAELN